VRFSFPSSVPDASPISFCLIWWRQYLLRNCEASVCTVFWRFSLPTPPQPQAASPFGPKYRLQQPISNAPHYTPVPSIHSSTPTTLQYPPYTPVPSIHSSTPITLQYPPYTPVPRTTLQYPALHSSTPHYTPVPPLHSNTPHNTPVPSACVLPVNTSCFHSPLFFFNFSFRTETVIASAVQVEGLHVQQMFVFHVLLCARYNPWHCVYCPIRRTSKHGVICTHPWFKSFDCTHTSDRAFNIPL
jgi:hypothetical protein